EAPQDAVFLVTRSPEGKERLRLTVVDVKRSHISLVIDAVKSAIPAIELALTHEVEHAGGHVSVISDNSLVAQPVIGPGDPPPPPPGGPDPTFLAFNLVVVSRLDPAKQQELTKWLVGQRV